MESFCEVRPAGSLQAVASCWVVTTIGNEVPGVVFETVEPADGGITKIRYEIKRKDQVQPVG